MIRKMLVAALIGAAFFGMVTHADAQTPTATPALPKASVTATATPVVAPPKAAAPAPAKTGNAGLPDSTGIPLAVGLVIGVAALVLVAGARTVTRKR